MSTAHFRVTNRQALLEAVDPPVGDVARELAGDASSGTPRRTGRMADSWTATRDRLGAWTVANSAPYARFVEYGTRHMRAAAPMGRAAARARARYG